MHRVLLALLVAALVPHLLLAGAGVVRLAVQLPARGRLGPVAFARYCRAADLGPGGRALYPLLGIGGPAALAAALAVGYATDTPAALRALLISSAGLCVLHSLSTARAAPAMIRIGRAGDDPAVLAPLIGTFTRWSWPRTILQALTAVTVMSGLTVLQGRWAFAAPLLTAAFLALCLVTVLAGAALDQVVVHIGVRRVIGTAAYARYLRNADLAAGRVRYPRVGLSSNAALLATFALAVAQPTPARYSAAFGVAAGCGAAALLVTRGAVPAASALARGAGPDEARAVERFVSAARARAPLFLIMLACLLFALISR